MSPQAFFALLYVSFFWVVNLQKLVPGCTCLAFMSVHSILLFNLFSFLLFLVEQRGTHGCAFHLLHTILLYFTS
jgi:hypothetical protein